LSEGESAVTVEVDRDACMGARVCTKRAPAAFGIGDDGKARVLDPSAAPLGVLLAAARDCPRFAIRVMRDGERVD